MRKMFEIGSEDKKFIQEIERRKITEVILHDQDESVIIWRNQSYF